MSRWALRASITRNGYYEGPGYVQGGAYIQAQGGDHEFYGRPPAPHYGWGRGWDAGPYGWGGYGGEIRFNVTIRDIGDFFRGLFQGGPPAANQPVYYDSAPPVADRYQRGGTLGGSAWQPYIASGGTGSTTPPPPNPTADVAGESPLIQGEVAILNPHARQQPVRIAADRNGTTDLPDAPPRVATVDLIANSELRLNGGMITGAGTQTIAMTPAASAPSWQRAVYGPLAPNIGNS